MPISKDTSRLTWLIAAWSEQRRRLAALLGRMTDLGASQALSPAGLIKFMRLMEQVGDAKYEEKRIINTIDAIEHRHRFRRTNKQLKQVGPAPRPVMAPHMNEACEPPTRQLTWIIALWYFMMHRQINQKNHDLTGN